jgi:hypothetical protein
MMETYSHLSPRCRIYNIERDIEKEHKELVAKFKASALRAQSYLAHSGWEYKELSLCCSNKERSVIKRRHEERLSTAKVAWEAAQHESKCVFKAAEKACVAAARLAEREQDDGKIKSRLVKAKAEEKAARKRCKSALKAAEKAFRIEVRLAEEEQKGRLLMARRDVCKNWDGSESRLERVLDNIASSGHASMEQMDSINKRMGRAQTLSLSLRECSEDEIAEMMEEESQLCQGVLTDIRRMQLASSSGKSPPASRQKKDTKTIQRGKALAEARGMLRILGRYRKDWDSTRGRCKTTSKGHTRQGWRSKSRVNGRGRRRKSHPSQGLTHSHSPCCGCCYCFCARHLGGSDPGREFASSSQLAMARSYFANAGILTKVEQLAPDASSLSLLLLATALVFCSLSSLLAMLGSKRRVMPATTAFAAGNGKFITLETICMCLVFFAALPEGALPLSSAKCLTLTSAAPSDAIMAVKAKIEAERVDEHASTTLDTVSSKSCAEHMEWGEAASQNKRCSDQCNFVKSPVDEVGNSHSNQRKIDEPRSNQCIFVKSPDSRLITVPFHPLKKISDVKREIKCRLKLDPSDYSLYINGWCKRLDKDDISLSDYGIAKDSTLVATVPMRAGGVATRSGSGSSAAKGIEAIAGRMENDSPREEPRNRFLWRWPTQPAAVEWRR